MKNKNIKPSPYRIAWLFLYSFILCLVVGTLVWFTTSSYYKESKDSSNKGLTNNSPINLQQNVPASKTTVNEETNLYVNDYLIFKNENYGGLEILYPKEYYPNKDCCRYTPQTIGWVNKDNLEYITTIVKERPIRDGIGAPIDGFGISYYKSVPGESFEDLQQDLREGYINWLSEAGEPNKLINEGLLDLQINDISAYYLEDNYIVPYNAGFLVLSFSGDLSSNSRYINDLLTHLYNTR